MENHLRRTDIPLAQRISGGERLGATLCRLSQSLYEEARRMQVEESAAALEAYFEILSACFGGNSGSIPRGAELRGQIQRYIAAHLSECTLDAAEIASAAGISVRHLHRLFLVTGATLGDYLRTLRLTGCRSDLAGGSAIRRISAIASESSLVFLRGRFDCRQRAKHRGAMNRHCWNSRRRRRPKDIGSRISPV
jgi:AraC-like DNA-binding protein